MIVILRCLVIVWIAALPSRVVALDVRTMIEKAVELIERGQPGLARSYVEPALIAPELHETERSRAYYIRGFSFYDQGLYVSARLDYNRALEFNPENPGALVALGDLHRLGHGAQTDAVYAFKLYEKAGKLGHRDAKVATGRALLLGEGAQRDVAAARRWLAEAASEGDANAMVHLGASYRLEGVEDRDAAKAEAWYTKAATAGAAEALLAIGYMHGNGEFGPADPNKALEWYSKAADLGYAPGQTLVGYAYLEGAGVPVDARLAGAWFERAAAQGDARAQVALGYLFEAGEGRPASPEQARKWYRKAALAGDREGISRYGWIMLEATDLQSQREAVIWLRKLLPDDIEAANTVAWVLATSQHRDLRAGAEAVRIAEHAVQQKPEAALIDTLAAAHAEAGNFEAAITHQRLALSRLTGEELRHKAEMEAHLAAYEKGLPWRD